MRENIIKKQYVGIYDDLIQASKTLMPLKTQLGAEAYRAQVIKAMTGYATALKAGKEYQSFCQKWNLDNEEFIGDILDKAIDSVK